MSWLRVIRWAFLAVHVAVSSLSPVSIQTYAEKKNKQVAWGEKRPITSLQIYSKYAKIFAIEKDRLDKRNGFWKWVIISARQSWRLEKWFQWCRQLNCLPSRWNQIFQSWNILKGMEREYATALDTMCHSLLVFSWITPICQKEKINKINKYITIIKLFVLYQTFLQFTYIFATFLIFWINVSMNHRPAARP